MGSRGVQTGWAAAVICAMAGLFVISAARQSGGHWPAPLDDVYIYFDHARSAALGAPFSWLPGNGYSSGATSPLYPLLLAPFWALGLRGSWLGVAALALALAGLVDLSRNLARLAGHRAGWLAAPLLVSVPLLDWSWFSGMELGLFAFALGRALAAGSAALAAPPHRRRRAQVIAGLWLALLPLTRPETVALSLALAIAVVHGAGALATLPSLARTLAPTACAVGGQAIANRVLTGEWQPAGAVRKLLTSDPYASGAAIALEVFKNAVVLVHEAFVRALGGALWLHVALVLAALLVPGHRRIGAALTAGGLGTFALTCLNGTARFQNYRYAAPVLAMLLATSLLGLAALASRRRPLVLLAGLAAVLLPLRSELRRQVEHFAAASRNIAEQHGEVARRVAALSPRRVLVGDAGAIPYLSGASAIDGLGLGGFRGLPFASASVHGMGAVVELVERLGPLERPDLMAVYPGWFPGIADRFGRRIDAVRIAGNVICAADEKVLYRADWSTLAPPAGEWPPGTVDRLDIADLVEERAHEVAFDRPGNGRVVARSLRLDDGRERWDAGRALGRGKSLELTVAAEVARGPARLLMRSDSAASVEVSSPRGGRVEATPVGYDEGSWTLVVASLADVGGGDRIRLSPASGEVRLFHLWIVR